MAEVARPHIAAYEQYMDGVLTGAISACQWVKLACERQRKDLARAGTEGFPYRFDPAVAERVCKFKSLMPHVKGRWARKRQRFALSPHQCFITCVVFGWVHVDTGLRRFQEAYIEVPRKNGKSFDAATTGLYLFAADNEYGAEVYCLDGDTRILTSDFQHVPLKNLSIGHEIWAFDEFPATPRAFRKLRRARIETLDRVTLPAYRVTFEDGRVVVASSEHKWLYRGQSAKGRVWRPTKQLRPGDAIYDFGPPWQTENTREAGYLAGLYDDEGWLRNTKSKADKRYRSGFVIGFSQNQGGVWRDVLQAVHSRGFLRSAMRFAGNCAQFEIAGAQQCFRFLGTVRPKRLMARAQAAFVGMAPNRRGSKCAVVVKIEYLGLRELIAVETTTRTLFAEGLFSHNSGATSQKQALEVFTPAREMALATPEFCYRYLVEIRAGSMVRNDGSKFEPVIGQPGDGSSPHGAIVDEFHEHTTPDLYDTMSLGMGAREQPLMYIITTAGTRLSGPCYQRHLYAQRVLQGSQDDDSFFAIIYTIDEGDDWTTMEAARKANPNFGISIMPERLERDLKAALRSSYLQNAYKTKRLNVWCGAKSAWMNMDAWLKCPRSVKLSKMKGRSCYVGVDLGSTDDPSAVMLLFPPEKGGKLWSVYSTYYLPEDAARGGNNAADYASWSHDGHLILTPGNVADYERITADVFNLLKAYRIEAVGYDPWQALAMASALLGKGVPMVKVPQNVQQLSEPMKQFERLILAGQLAHDHSPVTNWMMGNVTAKADARGNIYPNKQSQDGESKIDGVLALLNAGARAFAGLNKGGINEWLEAPNQE